VSSFFKNQDKAFIVYQMGKGGSSTFRSSLEQMHGKERVLHTHNHEEAKEYIKTWSQSFDAVIVVTGFREPVSRCISAYFQNLTNKSNHWYVGQQAEVMGKSIDWLISDYKTKVVPHIHKLVGPWLENYESVTNCKLTEFSRAKGCLKASSNNVHFYIYKLEALTEFHKGMVDDQYLNKIKLINSNVSKEKWYSKIYIDFKKQYKISRISYNELYGKIDYVRYLYDEQEMQKLTKSFLLEPKPLTKTTKEN